MSFVFDRKKLGSPTFVREFDRPIVKPWSVADRSGCDWKTFFPYGQQGNPNGANTGARVQGNSLEVSTDKSMGLDPTYQGGDAMQLKAGRLTAAQQANPKFQGKQYFGTLLSTDRIFHFQYGIVEVRMSVPQNHVGSWPAVCLYSAPVPDLTGTQWDQPGLGREWVTGLFDEIDVLELQGADAGTRVWQSVHKRYDWQNGVGSQRIPSPQACDSSFAYIMPGNTRTTNATTYTTAWTPDEIIWHVNDIETLRVPNPGIRDPMYVALVHGVGGWDANVTPAATFAPVVSVDHLRVYPLLSA
jgi:beta-glucanase (GH16 family)